MWPLLYIFKAATEGWSHSASLFCHQHEKQLSFLGLLWLDLAYLVMLLLQSSAVPYNITQQHSHGGASHHICRFPSLAWDVGVSGPFWESPPASTIGVELVREWSGWKQTPQLPWDMGRPLAEELPNWIFKGWIRLKKGEKGRGAIWKKTDGRASSQAQYSLPSPASNQVLST